MIGVRNLFLLFGAGFVACIAVNATAPESGGYGVAIAGASLMPLALALAFNYKDAAVHSANSANRGYGPFAWPTQTTPRGQRISGSAMLLGSVVLLAQGVIEFFD